MVLTRRLISERTLEGISIDVGALGVAYVWAKYVVAHQEVDNSGVDVLLHVFGFLLSRVVAVLRFQNLESLISVGYPLSSDCCWRVSTATVCSHGGRFCERPLHPVASVVVAASVPS